MNRCRLLLHLSAILVLLTFASFSANAQTLSPELRQKIDKLATDALAKSGVPSASVAGVINGQIAYVQALGQDSNTKPQIITLVARKKTDNYDNYTKAAFSFKYGINGDEAVKITGNDWDLLYGNISLNGDRDWFTVTLVIDDRSRIKDLGNLDWSDDIEIPALPGCTDEDKSCTTVTYPSASSGKMFEDVNPNVAKAIVGHMYLVHTKDRASDFYTLFRVEELEPSERCTITWRIVRSPEK